MILIDSIYINNSGGKILLDFLVDEIEKRNLNAFYLFDQRISGSFSSVPKERKIYLKATFINRLKFYLKNRSSFEKILCFGNIPPPIKVYSDVYTYFHQRLFLELPGEANIYTKSIFFIKSVILGLFRNNTNFWLVQSEQMTKSLIKRYNVLEKKVVVLPFYPKINEVVTYKKEKTHDSFVYVSNGSPHKNHVRLLRAFRTFYNTHKRGALHLTLSEGSSKELMAELEDLTAMGYPVYNHGFVEREQLAELYMSNNFTIYPSLSESFGLGIMEAIECGCQVIGADLPYMHAVCEPSIVFDPYSEDSIVAALEKAVFGAYKPSKLLVRNQIDDLLNLISS